MHFDLQQSWVGAEEAWRELGRSTALTALVMDFGKEVGDGVASCFSMVFRRLVFLPMLEQCCCLSLIDRCWGITHRSIHTLPYQYLVVGDVFAACSAVLAGLGCAAVTQLTLLQPHCARLSAALGM